MDSAAENSCRRFYVYTAAALLVCQFVNLQIRYGVFRVEAFADRGRWNHRPCTKMVCRRDSGGVGRRVVLEGQVEESVRQIFREC